MASSRATASKKYPTIQSIKNRTEEEIGDASRPSQDGTARVQSDVDDDINKVAPAVVSSSPGCLQKPSQGH